MCKKVIMDNINTNKTRIISFSYFLKITFISGFALGALASPFYAITTFHENGIIYSLLMLAVIPIANGIHLSAYGLFGYPLYKYLSKHGKFGFGDIEYADSNT